MRKWIILLLCLLILYTTGVPAAVASDEPHIEAKAYALIDAASGRVLLQKNGDARLPMASTTKVMTALVVLEHADLDEVIEIDRRASGVEGSSMYLEVGEKLTVEQLLLGLMLRSGNDAAVALANHVGGSVEGFADMMNAKAQQLGLAQTRFQNPHGLPAADHYTTAVDLCRIMAAAAQWPDFVRIAGTLRAQVPWDGHPWDRVMTNKNRMLTELDGCIGGKTGFTKEAGRCLVEAAERDGMRLVSVVLNCPDWWNQTERMMEYGFAKYESHSFLAAGETAHIANTGGLPGEVALVAREELICAVRMDEELALRLEAPVLPDPPYERGALLGIAYALADGEVLGSTQLVAGQAVKGNGIGDAVRRIWSLWYGG